MEQLEGRQKEIIESRQHLVVKSNDLINKSRFSLTTHQQKILLYLISKISIHDDDFQLYEFRIKDFCDVCGIDYTAGDYYTKLKEDIKKIADKSLWIALDNGEETLLRWIEKPYINKKSGTIKIKLDNDMKPFLLKLNERFTKYELVFALTFKSQYTIRLYEYIKGMHFNPLEAYVHEVTLEELEKRLDSKYKNFKDFHTRVLKPAVKEITANSDIQLFYKLVKEGRKVISIQFSIIPLHSLDVMQQRTKAYHLLDDKKEEQTKRDDKR